MYLKSLIEYLKARVKSFDYAFKGIKNHGQEPHMKIHIVAGITAILLGLIFRLSITEWIIITAVIIVVILAEMLNTIVENLLDFISLDYHPKIKRIKDMAAGMVLTAAIGAVIIACFIFIPKI